MIAAVTIIAIAALSICANDTVALVIVVCAFIALLGIGG